MTTTQSNKPDVIVEKIAPQTERTLPEQIQAKARSLTEQAKQKGSALLERVKGGKPEVKTESMEDKWSKLINAKPDPKSVEAAYGIVTQIYLASGSGTYPAYGFGGLMAALVFELQEKGICDPAVIKGAFDKLEEEFGGEKRRMTITRFEDQKPHNTW